MRLRRGTQIATSKEKRKMATETRVAIRHESRVGTAISRNQALFLLKHIWPDAPLEKQIEAAMICQQYRLNPLMRQVHLVKYDHYEFDKAQNRRIKTGEDWSVILGIGATRQIAQDEGKYSYTDGPRVLTEAEQETYLGEVDKMNLWMTTEITDRQGNKYRGLGFWPKDKDVKGGEKGNSKRHMAAIRSERDALKKYQPGRIPDLDVTDEDYTPITNIDQALLEGQKEFEAQAEQDKADLYPEEPIPATQPVVTQPEGKRDPATISSTADLARALWNDFGLRVSQQWAELKITSWNELTVAPAEAYRTIAANH